MWITASYLFTFNLNLIIYRNQLNLLWFNSWISLFNFRIHFHLLVNFLIILFKNVTKIWMPVIEKREISSFQSLFRKSLTWYPDFYIYKVLRNGRGLAGTECRPPFRIFFQYRGESLSGSRQQQVVNPFFKGSTAIVRFEVARVKRTPSGDLFVFFSFPHGGILLPSYRPVSSETPV